MDKGCLSIGQMYNALQVEEMLTEFAEQQVLNQYDIIKNEVVVCEHKFVRLSDNWVICNKCDECRPNYLKQAVL